MTTYNRIPISMGMGKGRAILEYSDSLCRITLQLQGIATDKLYKPYLLWEDSFLLLPKPLAVDRMGGCMLRCEVKADSPDKIKGIAVISEDLQPAAIGFVNGEYDWRKCFMMKEEAEAADKAENSLAADEAELKAEAEVKEQPRPKPKPATEEKQVFKSIVCRLSDDLQELKEYAQMPEFNGSDALFESHALVTPFYGCQGDWIQINLKELCQIGSLWKYINNPLVLYGCRHFHHLILGRDKDKLTLTLGIPWEYEPTYKLEAGIQGFTEIKPVNEGKPQKGEMCYLLTTLE